LTARQRVVSLPEMRQLIAAVASVLVVACSGAASPAPPTTLPSVTPSPTSAEVAQTPAATPTGPPATPQGPTPAPTPAVFASPVYPYTLELPPGALTRNWKPAAFPWDGEARIDTASRSVDITGTVGGGLLIFGLSWDADLAGFAELVRTNAERFNGCAGVEDPREVVVDGVPGIAQRQECEFGTKALYVALVRDGSGLGFRMRDYLVPEPIDDLVTWLDAGLTWTSAPAG
jgi:hypothetical protein